MKKLLLIGLTALLALSVVFISGCGGSSNPTTTAPAAATTTVAQVGGAGVAVKLVFQVQPGTGKEFEPLTVQPVVAAIDSDGNVVTSFNFPINVSITPGTGGNGMISGGVTVNAVNGVSTFSNVNIDGAGTGYTLTAKSGGLQTGVSEPFDITK